MFSAGPAPSPIGLCLEWCFLPQKSELRCVFAFPAGAIPACRHTRMFPGDVFRQRGSILLGHFPSPPWSPPCPSADGGDRDHPGGYSHAQGGLRGGTGQQVSPPKGLSRSLSCHCAALPGWFLEGSCCRSQPEPHRIPHWGPDSCRGLVGSKMGDASVSFSTGGETSLLFPQVNFRGSRSSLGCWAERTRAEKQLVVLVGVLAAVLVGCLLGLIFQYRARKSSHRAGTRVGCGGWFPWDGKLL